MGEDGAVSLVRRGVNKHARYFSSAPASVCIGELVRGMDVFCMTNGQVSILDVLLYLVEFMSPCEVRVVSFNYGVDDLRKIRELRESGDISCLRLIVDKGLKSRNLGNYEELERCVRAEEYRSFPCHAKVLCVGNGDYHFVFRGSMNMNRNRRCEQFDLSEGVELYDMMLGYFDTVFSKISPEESFKYVNIDRLAGDVVGLDVPDDFDFLSLF